MDPGYPKPITVWKGVPDAPQGAFVHKENGTRMRAAPCMPLPAAARVSERRTAAARCRLGGSRPGLGRAPRAAGVSPQLVCKKKRRQRFKGSMWAPLAPPHPVSYRNAGEGGAAPDLVPGGRGWRAGRRAGGARGASERFPWCGD